MSWRVTYTATEKSQVSRAYNLTADGVFAKPPAIASTPKLELRHASGSLIRLGQGSEFSLIDSPFGLRPQIYGEGYVAADREGGKYRTSCWTMPLPTSQTCDYFIRPKSEETSDQYFALRGDLTIIEFDSSSNPYVIACCKEGKMTEVQYKESETGPGRYSSSDMADIKDEDFEYILNEYVDSRKWR